jgi:arginase
MQEAERRTLDIISYDCGWGCGDYGTEDGPEAARLDKIANRLGAQGRNVILSDLKLRKLSDRSQFETKHETYEHTVTSVQKLAERSYKDAKNGVLPVVIGGDHSSAIGTWSGITSALEMEGDFGLLWIDAHMDAHTPQTADQGKWGGWWHGMPVACLTGNGTDEFTGLSSSKIKIKPPHIVLIGIRSFEPGEEEYVKKHNIKYYMADDLKQRGFSAIYQEALEYLTENCRGFGLSIDLDGFDPENAPGVGTPEKNGVSAPEALKMIRGLGENPAFHGLEIVEYNPHNDVGGKTATLISDIIETVFEAA